MKKLLILPMLALLVACGGDTSGEMSLEQLKEKRAAFADSIKQIDEQIAAVGLEEKRKVQAALLSGGQKRKLSLAIAMIANSTIVMLDEPTSGMDLTARQWMWNMLRNVKRGRIIILTTHYMEEADIVADRIAIMHEGKLNCLGSPLFLKNLSNCDSFRV